ncbi:MAG TPA: penicillin-binding transpeptidase domain-containing protein [Ktedonosporobacter sp.]|jgi:membrane peptidoglycan carboxypeptidase|nr:penicillin-binding transpeptidase domain-containing protein [Ktedonosporobacter sp.]
MSTANILPENLSRLQRNILLFLLMGLFSACSGGNPSPTATQVKGAIQLFDLHGKLICQIHGQDAQLDCFNHNAPQSAVAFQFIDYAVSELASDLHTSVAKLPSSALTVSTTLDLALQQQILQRTKQYIATMAATHNMRNAAVVMIDYHNGAIRSLLGSLDGPTDNSPLDVVTGRQQRRQPGSVFKPFVYATAFNEGISPGEVVYDGPFSVATGAGPYSPVNYDRRFHGYMSYRSALQNNFNIPALKLFVKTGFAPVEKMASDLGIKNLGPQDQLGYSLPLGPVAVPLLDATVAYGTMANGGVHLPPHAIEKISDPSGHVVYATQAQGTRALSPQAAFMLTDVMSDDNARRYEYGQCSPLLLYSSTEEQCKAGNPGPVRPAAVHVGETDTFRDTMAVGYTTDLVTGVWTGNSDYSPMFNIVGVDGAARIWHDTMLLAEGNAPVQPFPGPPPGVVKKTVSYPNLTTTDWYMTQ